MHVMYHKHFLPCVLLHSNIMHLNFELGSEDNKALRILQVDKSYTWSFLIQHAFVNADVSYRPQLYVPR